MRPSSAHRTSPAAPECPLARRGRRKHDHHPLRPRGRGRRGRGHHQGRGPARRGQNRHHRPARGGLHARRADGELPAGGPTALTKGTRRHEEDRTYVRVTGDLRVRGVSSSGGQPPSDGTPVSNASTPEVAVQLAFAVGALGGKCVNEVDLRASKTARTSSDHPGPRSLDGPD
jgi:hypothetical protein